MPAHDSEAYLGTALASLAVNQRDDFEFIVVDDGSSDGTGQLAQDFAERMPGVRGVSAVQVLHNAAPVGPGVARNQGLARATGRYLTYLDADDWIGPGHLAALVEAIEHLRCDFVRVDQVRCFGLRRELHRVPESRRGVVLDPRDAILPAVGRSSVDYPHSWAGIYDRSLADDGLLTFPAHLHGPEDRPWIWRLHLRARSFAAVSLAGNFYRKEVPTSLTQAGEARLLHIFDALELLLAEVERDAERDRFIAKAVRTCCELMTFHLDHEARLTPALRAEQRSRATQVLDAMPPAELDEVLSGMRPDHQRLLRELMTPASESAP